MAYPVTHLYVAHLLLKKKEIENAEMFLLGSIAPDAVHFRKCFQGAGMAEIGAAKKITHLCPVSGEKWGQVTDNERWEKNVASFLAAGQNDSFRLGYATHVLTDIYNNKTLWHNYRTNHPNEAKKGYGGGYYDDLRQIDRLLKENTEYVEAIFGKLSASKSMGMDGLVDAHEVSAIKQSLLDEIYSVGKVAATSGGLNKIQETTFVSYDEMLIFIKNAALFCGRVVL